jgi:N-carbamoylputrescine amidase
MAKPRSITVAGIQTRYGEDMANNIARTEGFVREAAQKGAQIVLPSELFQGIYFCTRQDPKWFLTAYPAETHPCVIAMQRLARELGVVIPVSIFEKDGPRYYNSIVIVDSDGTALGIYRKSHIPDGPGYQEKYYFRPGDTGFKVWQTKAGRIGVGICWDQWYPECARAMVLQGAEVLFYPTAIGSEPYDAALDTHLQWQRAMQGHAVSNAVPIVAANRIGLEDNDGAKQKFYGHSFITDHRGEIVESFGEKDEGILVHTFDLGLVESYRADWGFFRDRRTDL